MNGILIEILNGIPIGILIEILIGILIDILIEILIGISLEFCLCRLIGRTLPDTLVYADSQTYSGPDEDPNFDQDDELVFMARHLGSYRAKQNQFIFNVSN